MTRERSRGAKSPRVVNFPWKAFSASSTAASLAAAIVFGRSVAVANAPTRSR
ncbi:hypothetical protein D3C83_309170 [compost metagenome]